MDKEKRLWKSSRIFIKNEGKYNKWIQDDSNTT